jgi:Predicted membrane protein (DUF2157)
MDLELFERLNAEGSISNESLVEIRQVESNRLFSIHWELNSILYAGVLMLTSGLGILVYENIDSIGHMAVLTFIALVSSGGYYYCWKKKFPFSTAKVQSPNAFVDYLLLLACLCFIIFIGYWQYEYHFFGDRFGLVTFIPMVLLFFTAYFFDHLGILCLAITNLAAWVGIVVTPTRILKANDFNSGTIIFTALGLGLLLFLLSKLCRQLAFKPHFAFTYANFGMNLMFISCLAAQFHFDHYYLLWFIGLGGIAYYFYREAVQEKSFYYLLMLTLYFFIGFSEVALSQPFWGDTVDAWMLFCLYFIGAGVGLILFLIRMNKKFKES